MAHLGTVLRGGSTSACRKPRNSGSPPVVIRVGKGTRARGAVEWNFLLKLNAVTLVVGGF